MPLPTMDAPAGVDSSASHRINAIAAGFGALILLCLVALMTTLIASSSEALAMAEERERAQIANGIATRLDDMRSDLTSVTFWDEAVEKTAIAYDRSWAEENVGVWLADFYGVDASFVLDSGDRLALASRSGKTASPASFRPYEQLVAPMIARVRAKGRLYRPGHRFAGDRTRGLDEARLAVVDGQPVYVIVAPIQPDFGRLSRPPGRAFLVVAVHAIDQAFLAKVGRSVLLPRIRLVPAAAAVLPGELRWRLTDEGAGFEVRWVCEQRQSDLLGRFAPILAASMVVILVAGVVGVLFVRRTARRLCQSQLDATHDMLSGLPNRRLLTCRLEQELAAGTPLALLFIDLDGFKEVNDRWGHAAGDEVIRTAARRLAAVPGTLQVARFGGDEFVVLVDRRQEPAAVARQILAILRQPFPVDGMSATLSGSIGIAVAPDHAATASELMRLADLALYRAKRLGKNQAIGFDQAMDQHPSLLRYSKRSRRHGSRALPLPSAA